MATKNKPITVGIVGLGRSGWAIHARAIQAQPDSFAVAAVVDPLEERRTTAARELGCVACASVEELLRRQDVELVIVAAPNAEHAPMSIAALAAGKHVLCRARLSLGRGKG